MKEEKDIMYMLGKIAGDTGAIKENLAMLSTKVDKHEEKIDAVEKWQGNATGKLWGISAATGFIVSIINFFSKN